jgi:histone-binding protein RBBP4
VIAVDFHCMYSINNVFCDIFIGRDKIVDFHWNSSDPWTIVSVSDDGESTGGGGTLQIWRMSDLIYRPEDEVLAELENFKTHLASCAPRS